ncbi:hypothetical protein V8G54_022862, partial [Vigna mungo]
SFHFCFHLPQPCIFVFILHVCFLSFLSFSLTKSKLHLYGRDSGKAMENFDNKVFSFSFPFFISHFPFSLSPFSLLPYFIFVLSLTYFIVLSSFSLQAFSFLSFKAHSFLSSNCLLSLFK